MVDLHPIILTTAITSPSILYLFVRFAHIFADRWRSLRHHVLRGGITSALAVHVIGGIALLGTTPYLAYLCVPPTRSNPDDTWQSDSSSSSSSSSVVQQHRYALFAITIILTIINANVFFLLPHPLLRHKEYKTTQRMMVRSVTLFHACVLQFVAMSLGPIAFLSQNDVFAGITLLVVTILYAITVAISYCEMRHVPWEESPLARVIFATCIAYGTSAKSTLVSNAINDTKMVRSTMMYRILFGIGIYAGIQSAMQCIRFLLLFHLNNNDDDDSNNNNNLQLLLLQPPDPNLEDWFIVLMTYTTVIMSASFFSFSQFDPRTTTDAIYSVDGLFGVLLPVMLNALGPYWMMNNNDVSSGDGGVVDGGEEVPFAWQWTFWTRSIPW